MSEDEALFAELRLSKGLIGHEGYDSSDIDDAIELITKLRGQLADAPHGPHCSSLIAVPEPPRYGCDCWRAGL